MYFGKNTELFKLPARFFSFFLRYVFLLIEKQITKDIFYINRGKIRTKNENFDINRTDLFIGLNGFDLRPRFSNVT